MVQIFYELCSHSRQIKIKEKASKKSKRGGGGDKSCELVGGRDNFEHFLKHMRPLVKGLKYDSLTLNSFLQHMKVSRVAYLRPLRCDRMRTLVLLCVLRWVIEDVALALLKAAFYVTDTSRTNFELFFFMKKTWSRIVAAQLSDSSHRNYARLYNLEKISMSDAVSYCSRFESSGVHMGRLLPKIAATSTQISECRIITGCRVLNPHSKRSYNVNYKFITLHQCLMWLIRHEPTLTGFACLSNKSIHRKYAAFVAYNSMNRNYGLNTEKQQQQQQQQQEQEQPLKKWHLMKLDIKKCFDSIDTRELISYVNSLFGKHLGIDYVFSLLTYASLKYDVDHRDLKCKYERIVVKHRAHTQGFRYGIGDFIRVLDEQQLTKGGGGDGGLSSSSSASSSTVPQSPTNHHPHNQRQQQQTANSSAQSRRMTEVIYVPANIHDRSIGCRQLRDALTKCLNHILIKVHNDIYERMNGVMQGSIWSVEEIFLN